MIAAVAATAALNCASALSNPSAASRLPQSRRLRPSPSRPETYTHAASRLPQSRRLRQNSKRWKTQRLVPRLKIAAVAATAAVVVRTRQANKRRLKIAAVAATAAFLLILPDTGGVPPQDCRSRGDCGKSTRKPRKRRTQPPQDCRSRGDCGNEACP